MKTLNLLLVTVIFCATGFAQAISQKESIASDASLSSSIIGTWEHVSSTYPSGDVTTYKRKFQFFEDGKGICSRYTDLDTVFINFQWEVRESVISLFEIRKNGKRIYADSQILSFVDINKMYLTDAYCDENTGKIACYRRVESEIAKY